MIFLIFQFLTLIECFFEYSLFFQIKQEQNKQKKRKIAQNLMSQKEKHNKQIWECNNSTYKNNKQQNKMIPNQLQQAANDYGFNLSKKYNIAKQPSQPNTQFNSPYQFPNTYYNNYSHYSMHSGNQFNTPYSLQSHDNEYKRSLIIGNYPQMARPGFEARPNNAREMTVIPSPQSYNRVGSSELQKQWHRKNPSNSQKQLTTVQTMPSVQHLLPLNPSIHIQAFNDFLYKFVGIVSCHVRVQQRSALQQITHYVKFIKSVRRCTGFCEIVNNIIKNKLQFAIICIKFNTMHESAIRPIVTSNRRIEEPKTRQVTKKITKIQSLSDSKFNLQQSAVEKGLKYLQDRANERKRKQQQKNQARNKNIKGSLNNILYLNDQPNQIETGKFIQIRSQKNQKNQSDPYLTKQVKDKTNKAIGDSKNQNNFQFSSQNNKKKNQEKEPSKIMNKITLNPNENFDNNEQNIKQNMKQASWLVLGIKQNPYLPNNRKQNFQRYEANENKYHLNPDTFKQSEPDVNDFVMPAQYNMGGPQMLTQYGIPKKLGPQTTRSNILQDTLPLFDPTNNQGATRFWEAPIQANQHIDNLIKNNQNTFVNPYIQAIDGQSLQKQRHQQKLMDSLPSFNQKGNQFINDRTATFQQDQKQRRHSDLAHYNLIDKDKGSQLRISDQEDEQEIQEMDDQYNFNKKTKRNKITQYYTEKNIGNKETRASFDFPNKSGTKSQRPVSRPKSMTYSIGNESTKQAVAKQINVNKLQNKKINPQLKNGRFQLPPSTSKPKININYESPKYQNHTPVFAIPIAPHPYQNASNYQNLAQVQNTPRLSFYQYGQPQNQFRQQQVCNKPARAVSSGCKFFYAQPKQYQNMQQSLPPNLEHKNIQRQQIMLNNQYYPPNQKMYSHSNQYSNPIANPYFHQGQITNQNIPNYASHNINSPRNAGTINYYKPPQDYNSLQQSQQQQSYNFISSKPARKGINVYVASEPSALNKYHSEKNLRFLKTITPVQLPGVGRKIHVTTAEQN